MKLTGWYRGDQKPARVGVYQRDYSDRANKQYAYCRFDGKQWYVFGDTVKEAAEQEIITCGQFFPWRGVAK